ncbi:integrase [Yersinia pestis]|nr:integrase [Yersinia pestis]EDR60276.1 transferase [Yersinia pestis biovar Antiqua str. UG05-0454]
MGRWWRYKWITFHPSLTAMRGQKTQGALRRDNNLEDYAV